MYTRESPSPRYIDLIGQYKTMHAEGEKFLNIPAEHVFPGSSLFPQMRRIKRLIDLTGAQSILDYGAGKGRQYEPLMKPVPGIAAGEAIMDFWGVDSVHCYDPCYPPYSQLPAGQFDGVISTDVLEHCPEEDIPWILGEIFSYARGFVFANVACYPAKKRLPTGENAHCTIKEPAWWQEQIARVASGHKHLLWEVWIQFQTPGGLTENRISNDI